jgi:hypothetical protein
LIFAAVSRRTESQEGAVVLAVCGQVRVDIGKEPVTRQAGSASANRIIGQGLFTLGGDH